MDTTDRTAYTTGLRKLADILDANPDLRLPYQGSTASGAPLSIHIQDGNLVPALELRDLLEDAVTCRDPRSDDFPVDISGHLAGLHVTIHVGRTAALADPLAPIVPLTDPRLGLDDTAVPA